MTNLEALKALYVALGGSSSTVAPMERSCDVIYAMAQIIPSNAFNQLPSVTAANNGAILKVVNGAWAVGTDNGLPAVTASDNGSVLKVADGAWGIGADNGLPAVSATDNGSVLKVIDGAWGIGTDNVAQG